MQNMTIQEKLQLLYPILIIHWFSHQKAQFTTVQVRLTSALENQSLAAKKAYEATALSENQSYLTAIEISVTFPGLLIGTSQFRTSSLEHPFISSLRSHLSSVI